MINQTIQNAIKKYVSNNDEKSFDVKVIRILVMIFGKEKVLSADFKSEILKIGVDQKQYLLLDSELANYMENNNMSSFLTIYKILIDMIVLKYKDSYITNEEVANYEKLFYEGKSINFLNEYWNKALYEINKSKNGNENSYNPYNNYLQRKNLDDIKALNDEDLVKEQQKSLDKYYKNISDDINDKKISSGNGFVDIMMILAIIGTQIMIGFIALGRIIGG